MGEAKDWGNGLALKAQMLGKMSKLEVHHIFPKAQLYKHAMKYRRAEVNAVANFCFQSKETNLEISDRLPEEYFPAFEERHPGGLASQWIPTDPALWKLDKFRDFLEARKELLAAELNRRMEDLLHGDTKWLSGHVAPTQAVPVTVGGITSEEEDEKLEEINIWIETQGLPQGLLSYDYADAVTGEQKAIFDLAWPNGIQEELSQPVALLLDESADTIAIASQAGFRCFTDAGKFREYVETEVLGSENPA
jgi:hypothetical protein